MSGKQPTKADLVAALREMHSLAQQLYACYANDVQPNRAEEMHKLRLRADMLSEITWRMPLP